MFGNNKKTNNDNTALSTTGASSAINTIVTGTKVEGTINAKNDLRVDGIIEGTLHCTGKLIIGTDGKVDGDAHCQNAVIEGKFNGNLTVAEILDVRESASVVGEIKTGKLLVQNGATFNGNCDMGQSKKIKSIPNKRSEATAS